MVQAGTGVPVVLSDVWPWGPEVQLYNALDFAEMCQLTAGLEPGRFAFVTSPWYLMNDLALPVMMACQPAAVFAHVSWSYYTDAHDRRRAWLRNYDVHLICIDRPGNSGRRCCWLCIFPKGGAKDRLLRLPRCHTVSLA